MSKSWNVLEGDCRDRLRELPDQSIHMVWTSPPYYKLRDYGHDAQIGLEPTPDEFVQTMVTVMREVHRVLRDDGTLWLNIGDSYGGSIVGGRAKDLQGLAWRVALALQEDGWYLRNDIIWAKGVSNQQGFVEAAASSMLRQGISPEKVDSIVSELELSVGNAKPESVTDRFTQAHEYLFLLSKKPRYFFDHLASREVGVTGSPRNRRTVWLVPTKPFDGAHFAAAPEDLVAPCIEAGTSQRGCCAACGAPYTRLVKVEGEEGTPLESRSSSHIRQPGNTPIKDHPFGYARDRKMLGWEPTCFCSTDKAPVPCTVLDPFAGAGTTLLMADQLNRQSIGIELNPDYVEIIEKRILHYRNELPPFDERYLPVESDSELPSEIPFEQLLNF